MTREEQIIETAKFIYFPSSGIPQSLPMRVGFIEGAKWADETMIDKACKWLLDNSRNYFEASGCCTWINYGKLADDFKKAMKGE